MQASFLRSLSLSVMATNLTFHPGSLLACIYPNRCAIAHHIHRLRRSPGKGESPATERYHHLVHRTQRERKGRISHLRKKWWSHRSPQSTVACALEQHLLHLHKFTYRLDGDNIRFGLNKDLGFDEKSRNENIRRIGEVRSFGNSPLINKYHLFDDRKLRSLDCLRMLRASR